MTGTQNQELIICHVIPFLFRLVSCLSFSLLSSRDVVEKAEQDLAVFHKDLEDRNLLQAKSLKLEKIMNEKMSKRRIQITDLQKQEIEEKQERRLLIRLHIFYLILLINL